jgi:hypothetical protein
MLDVAVKRSLFSATQTVLNHSGSSHNTAESFTSERAAKDERAMKEDEEENRNSHHLNAQSLVSIIISLNAIGVSWQDDDEDDLAMQRPQQGRGGSPLPPDLRKAILESIIRVSETTGSMTSFEAFTMLEGLVNMGLRKRRGHRLGLKDDDIDQSEKECLRDESNEIYALSLLWERLCYEDTTRGSDVNDINLKSKCLFSPAALKLLEDSGATWSKLRYKCDKILFTYN